MNDEQNRPESRKVSLDQRLASDPCLYERLHQIADMRDGLIEQGYSMDEVEEKIIEQIRLLGKELLGGIAQQKADRACDEALRTDKGKSRDSKKSNLVYHLRPH
jgi:hypothetical protein